MSYQPAQLKSDERHDNAKSHQYCETIDPDNQAQGGAQDCIDYDPFPGGGVGGGGGTEISKSNVIDEDDPMTGYNSPKGPNKSTTGKVSDSTASSFQKSFIQSVAGPVAKHRTNTDPPDVQKGVKRVRITPTDAIQSPEIDTKQKLTTTTANSSDQWHTVGFFNELTANVKDFIPCSTWSLATHPERLTTDNVPDLSKFNRVPLEPGTAYRFRLRAINGYGIGEPGESSSFKTCLPGFPGAPSSIKITKSVDGAHLVWQPPPSSANEKLEYTVYLAIKPQRSETSEATIGQLAFVRVYSGVNSQCLVGNSTLASAHVDYSAKPAIIFRITARNAKGSGPATQVRWLQDTSALASGDSNVSKSKSIKRK